MLLIFMGVAQCFIDSGFGAALIQQREATLTDTCSIFYFNIIVGLTTAGCLCLVAPWIAAFYNQPILTQLTRLLSVIIIINSFGMIQSTILVKQINFKTQTKISLIAGVLSGTIGITLAVAGFGVWSLAFQQVSSALFQTACLWFFSPWRPALIFSLGALRKMFGFGSRMLLSSVLNQLFENSYILVIGKLFSVADVGFFTRAKTLQELPSQTLSGMVGRVTFPVFSTIQDDPIRLKRGMKKTMSVLVLINFPVMLGLALVARPLVLLLLTEKWAQCIPYFQLLCLVGLLYPVHLINLTLLQALGHSNLFLQLEIIKKILIAITLSITWRWGISAIIYGMLLMSIISYYVNSYFTGVLIGYPIREQLCDIYPYLIIALLMGGGVYAAGLLPLVDNGLMLLVQVTIGTILYVCLCRTCRLAAFMELWQAVWNRSPFLKARMVR